MTVTVRIYGVSHIRVHSMIMKQFISNVKNNVFVSAGYDNSPASTASGRSVSVLRTIAGIPK